VPGPDRVHRPGPGHPDEYTADGENLIDLPPTSPYEAMIDHVLA
jgi:hypothetical protein